jgi:predicted extracellular nuclease
MQLAAQIAGEPIERKARSSPKPLSFSWSRQTDSNPGSPADWPCGTGWAQTAVDIHAIAVNMPASPYLYSTYGSNVSTTGIVIAVLSDGFYIENPNLDFDSNMCSSEGIYVYTGTEYRLGHQWLVRGTYEYQFLPNSPNFTNEPKFGIKPNGVSAGISYRLWRGK